MEGDMAKFERKDIPLALFKANVNLYTGTCRQEKRESVEHYQARFFGYVDLLKGLGGQFGDDVSLVHFEIERSHSETYDIHKHKPGNDVYDSYVAGAEESYSAAAFLQSSDDGRFGQRKADLAKSYRRCVRACPVTVEDAFRVLETYTNYLPLALYKAKIKVYTCRQRRNEQVGEYYVRLNKALKDVKILGGSIGEDRVLVHFEMTRAGITVDEDVHKPGNDVYDEYIERAAERYAAAILVLNADDQRFRSLKSQFRESYSSNKPYPDDVCDAVEYLRTGENPFSCIEGYYEG